MGKRRKKPMGPVVYYLDIRATSEQAGKPPLKNSMGPFASLEEAEFKQREQEEARGLEGYEYAYRIRPESVFVPR